MARRGARKASGQEQELVSWEQLDALFKSVGAQVRCRMDNSKLADAEKRQDCDSIVIEPAG